MASDSIVSGIADQISDDTKNNFPTSDVINSFLGDTQQGLTPTDLTERGLDGLITSDDLGASRSDAYVSYTGIGSNNEVQTILFGSGVGGDAPVEFQSPTGLTISGSSNSVITIETSNLGTQFIQIIVDTVVGGSTIPGAMEVGSSISNALSYMDPSAPVNVVQVLNTPGHSLISDLPGGIFDSPLLGVSLTGREDQILGVNLNGLDSAILVSGATSILGAGAGTIVGAGATHDLLIGADSRDQIIIGGSGNDTIIGGGGNDTIVGGAGSDIFVVSGNLYNPGALSHETLTIADFGQDDILRFTSYEDLDDLKDNLLNLFESSAGVVAMFADGSAIVLVGVELEDLHKDLFDFG